MDRALRVKDISEQLGVSQHNILAWIHKGELRASDVSANPTGKARWRIRQADLDTFLRARQRQPPQPRRRRRTRKDPRIIQYF